VTPRLPRVVLVTGASSGIGLATAHELAGRGERLVLLARSREPLAAAAAACRERGAASVTVVRADVGDAEAVQRAVSDTVARHGRLDAVVHCAAVVGYGRVEDVPADVFEAVLRTNVTGSVNVARAVVPVLRRQGGGTLVLLGSLIGQIGVPFMGPYTVSKWAVRALVRTLQLENRDLPDVHVTLVVPGGVDTPIYDQAANYRGVAGRPPPPVDPPEKVARAIVRVLDRPRQRVSVGAANPLMTLGFVLSPWLFDGLVGPLFAVLAGGAPRPPGPGNVLAPQPAGEGLRGGFGGTVRTLAGSLTTALRR
jgi:NAD(P)-dependent dehydrogenase (short-subunit alcohol dehydrogenase family)